MAEDSFILNRLIELGRTCGRLTTDDLRRALPIETMSTEELESAIVRLEDVGIEVEIDPTFLRVSGQVGIRRDWNAARLPNDLDKPAANQNEAPRSPVFLSAAPTQGGRITSEVRRSRASSAGFILIAVLCLALVVWAFWRLA